MAFSSTYLAGVDANRTIKDELTAAIARRTARRRISVTDLINPRQSFFARIHPDLVVPADRREVMMAGTGVHDVFGRTFSTEEYVEQLIEFDEIVGKIDIYEDAPIELKTSAALPDAPATTRVSHVEQLAMYCVMTGRPAGHLLYFQRAVYGREPRLRAFDLEVLAPESIRGEMRRRRDLFRRALETHDPAGLERCEWFGRDCLYSQFCGCGSVGPLPRMVSETSVRVAESPDLTGEIEARLRTAPAPGARPDFNLNDLVFPRKAALKRTLPDRDPEAEIGERLGSIERRGFLDQLQNAVWYGLPGACRRVRVNFESLRPSVLLFRDTPTLIRHTARRDMFPRDRLHTDAPYYIDRLGFECAVMGSERGRLIIYYSAQPDDKFMVYDIWFRDLEAIGAEMRRRLSLLDSGAPAAELPPCEPDWMAKLCDFGDNCACRVAP